MPRFFIYHCPHCEYYDMRHTRCPTHILRLEKVDVTEHILELMKYSPEYLKEKRDLYADFYTNYNKYLEAGLVDEKKLPRPNVRTLITLYDTALWNLKVARWRER